ncbi:3-isopropylmalate dehydrogenase [Endomicrobium proavitum]|uniref:3-isopropylmalate dehydrogenase n=1 Tax=Endomicrobium proavitum TaxID=1408281 RepID=A0A0G3WHS8_9BACT|nr:3-isopropylmalate dehydrogenase [Endomicrobium proavitum]AKL97883.1 3-isopropylmalate dehydrogenase [Endomicrobium proavitum]
MSKSYNVALLPGDGTGPEVIREGVKVIEAAAKKNNFKLNFTNYDLGGERYMKTGEVLPESVIEEFKKFDVMYLGAIGHPDVKPGILEKGILLKLRFELDQYINLRPVKLYPNVETPLKDKKPADIDMVIVRENTEGIYIGAGGFLRKDTLQEVATQESINTRFGVERCVRYAFDLTKKRAKNNKLTLCGKTNVLTFASDLWQRTFNVAAKDYPTIKGDYVNVDAVCMWLVKNPEWFDVIVTDNLFGDIITDLAAMIQGGMGVASGGNINPEGVSMFEPMGGSAPKYTGQNIINPIATINAGALLLENIGEAKAAKDVDNAVIKALESGKIKSMSAGKMGLSTTEVGDLVASYL